MENPKTYANIQIQSALNFAVNKHAYQWRKNTGSPYILHPLQVVDKLSYWKIDKEKWTAMWVAAILHDVIEDTDTTYEEIDYLYGNRVAHIVRELTHRNPSKNEDIQSYKKYKREDYLNSFTTSSIESFVIKIADRISNISDFSKEDPEYAFLYFRESKHLLFTIFKNRTAEIIDKFGQKVFDRINFDITKLD